MCINDDICTNMDSNKLFSAYNTTRRTSNYIISPVARPGYPLKFWGNHFIAFFDRYDGPD